MTLETDADLRTMETAIRRFGKNLGNGDVGLFYYAGHGLQVKNHNYLIPVGATLESEGDVKYEAVDAGLVLAKMEDAENKLNIVILDACRNNTFSRSFWSSAPGLAQMDAPTGSLIAYATAPGSVAADGEGQNGVYTGNLLKNMGKSVLAIYELFNQTGLDVMAQTNNKQVTWVSSTLVPKYFLARGTTAVKTPSVKIAPAERAVS